MVRRVTPSQFRSMVQQQQNRQKQAVRKLEQALQRAEREAKAAKAQFVREVNRGIDKHNRAVRQENQRRRSAVQKYNASVQQHNAHVERERQRRLAALRSLSSPRFVEVRSSSIDLNESYQRITPHGVPDKEILAAAEREISNSASVAYSLNAGDEPQAESAEDTGILDYLDDLSQDLCDRWRGAIFALNPTNADAARHFCTSVREIFTEILDRWADNKEVIAADPGCERTQQGTPSRRAKIRFLLKRKEADSPEMVGFVEKDIDDILQLFPVFNKATHGAAGTITFSSLVSLRKRVEGGIMFLATIAS